MRPALWPVWPPVQWMLWILPQRWSSWCMRLITQLFFLPRLQISAVVIVLPLYVFMVYTGTSLPFTIVLEEWLQYLCGCNYVPQKMRAVWSHGTVCHSTVLCCVITQNVVIWWSVWRLGYLCACGFSFCVLLIYWLSVCIFICCSTVTTVVWTHNIATSSLCFLKFRGCDMFWSILAMTSRIS